MELRKSVLPPANCVRRAFRKTATLFIFILAAMLVLPSAAPAQPRGNYYRGMHNQVRQGDYNRYVRDDDRHHHHDSGGIGPGKGALIGTAGGAALGAVFGRSLKSTIIGGAAGAAAGAIGGAIADHDNNHKHR
jgi:hypothetical protein